jgi:hypothetical protein
MKSAKILAISLILTALFILNILISLTNCAFGAPNVFYQDNIEIPEYHKIYSNGPVAKEIDELEKQMTKKIYASILRNDLKDSEKMIDEALSNKKYINAIFIKSFADMNFNFKTDNILFDDDPSDYLYSKLKPDYKNITEYTKENFDFLSKLFMRKYHVKDKKNHNIATVFVYISFNDGTWK